MKKVIFTTTLSAIRDCRPCESGWKKLLAHLGKKKADAEPLNLLTILVSNGTQDMLWALQAVEHPALEKIARLMAADFAEAVLPIFEKEYPKDNRPRKAIQAARDFANGKIGAAARAAAGAAAWAARAAAWAAAWAAAGDAAGDEQAKIIRKYLKEK